MEHRNTGGNNYGSRKVKDFKGKRTNSLESRGQTKDFSRRKYLSELYSRISSIRKELV